MLHKVDNPDGTEIVFYGSLEAGVHNFLARFYITGTVDLIQD